MKSIKIFAVYNNIVFNTNDFAIKKLIEIGYVIDKKSYNDLFTKKYFYISKKNK
jgi:hypothetical protein